MNRSQIKKIKTNTIILDAYNANPSSMSLAISNFENQTFENKMVVLGDMLELGDYSYKEHEKILTQLLKGNINSIILVGSHFLDFKDLFPNYNFFMNIDDVKDYVLKNQINHSTLLIKGSRGMQLEKIVDYL